MNRSLLFASLAFLAVNAFSSEPPLNDFENETAQWEKRLEQRQKDWRKEKNETKRAALAADVKEAAIQTGNPEAVDEVLANGDPERLRIQIPEKTTKVSIQVLHEFHLAYDVNDWPVPLVARRMTADRVELWTSETGWLFDAQGKLLNTAKVPRRDGHGREWFGAFLPDGRWITTDLWDRDDSLHFFSAAGKFNKSIATKDLVPEKLLTEDYSDGPGLVGWARSAKDGKSWIVSMGDNFTLGTFRVTPSGACQKLEDPGQWKESWPRDLGSRGMYIHSANVNDDFKQTIQRSEAGHGMHVGFPVYNWEGSPDICVPEAGQNFGFWPDSRQVWIGNNKYLMPPNPSAEERSFRTWFLNNKGQARGWISAERISEAPDNKSMWLVDTASRVIEINPDLKPTAVRTFAAPDGSVLFPHKLYPDLKLGFFMHDGKIVMGRW